MGRSRQYAPGVTFRLVASDLDGTLLRDDESVAPRTRAALDTVRATGAAVIPVTARQPIGVRAIAAAAGFDGWALCSNGALCVDLRTGEARWQETVAVTAQQALAHALSRELPGVQFASVRDRGEVFVAERDYIAGVRFADHKRDPRTMIPADLDLVTGAPSLKFLARHPALPPGELLAAARTLGTEGVELTHSNAPFLEVAPAGITKGTALARLCDELGVAQGEVLAFGDAPNDRDMIAWAGHGVAVGNAAGEVRAAAAEVTASNEDDGVARVLERLLAGGAFRR